MTRILSIVPFSPPSPQYGGAKRQAHSLHQGLMAKGVDVHVLAYIGAVGQPPQREIVVEQLLSCCPSVMDWMGVGKEGKL